MRSRDTLGERQAAFLCCETSSKIQPKELRLSMLLNMTCILLLCSISVPSMASTNLLVTAGNMARDSQMQISFLGMRAAAAGLALAERRWFHISKARASRCKGCSIWTVQPQRALQHVQRHHDCNDGAGTIGKPCCCAG